MADTSVSTQSNAIGGQSRVDRSQYATSATAGSLRPVSPVAGIQRDFSFVQPQQAVQAKTQALPDRASAPRQEIRRGSNLLSDGALLLLAETRTQEASSTFVAPASVGTALGKYQAVAASVRETIRANQFASGLPMDSDASGVTYDEDSGDSGFVDRPGLTSSVA